MSKTAAAQGGSSRQNQSAQQQLPTAILRPSSGAPKHSPTAPHERIPGGGGGGGDSDEWAAMGMQRHPSTSSIASTVDGSLADSTSSHPPLTSPLQSNLTSYANTPVSARLARESSASAAASPLPHANLGVAVHSLVSPASTTSSRNSGYVGSPDSPGDALSPVLNWKQQQQYAVAPAVRVRSDAKQPLKHSSSLTHSSTRPAGPPMLRTQFSAESSVLSPPNAHGLQSPPLQRSQSPERIFSPASGGGGREGRPSSARRGIIVGETGIVPVATATPTSTRSSKSKHRSNASLQQQPDECSSPEISNLPQRGPSSSQRDRSQLTSPPSASSSSHQRPALSLRLDSSVDSVASGAPTVTAVPASAGSRSSASPNPATAGNPLRSPLGLSLPVGSSVPNFAKGSFLGSPLAFGDVEEDLDDFGSEFEEGEEDDGFGSDGGGGIEILETIPASEADVRAHEEHQAAQQELQEREEAIDRDEKWKANIKPLRIGPLVVDESSNSSGGGGGILSSSSSASASHNRMDSSINRDAYVQGNSPKNANVFGLRLKHTSDSVDMTGTLTGSNSLASTGQQSLRSSQVSQPGAMNDSLTNSGRIALANFHASQAANQSKRMPVATGGGGAGSKRGSRSGAAGGVPGGKHRVNESYDVSQHGILSLDGFEIGSMGVQRTPDVQNFADEDDEVRQSREMANRIAMMGAQRAGTLQRIGEDSAHGVGDASPPADSDASPAATPPSIASQGRRPSAIAAKFLTTPGGGLVSANDAASSSSSSAVAGAASLGVEFRLSDMVRIGDLGVGQNGTVVKACYLPSLTIVALKACTVFEKDERHQMMKELKAFNSCSSPHIISFVGACFREGRITMALEFMNRGSLDQVVKKMGKLSIPMLRNISRQVCKGLKHMHFRKLIHRDIKPANVLIDNEGNCKISDFGLLKQLDATNQMASTFVGTLLYLSPERITGEAFSYPSDIWSWGISMIYLATGHLDLPKDYWAMLNWVKLPSPTLDRTVFPASLCDFVDACLIKNPQARWTAADLLKHPFLLETDPPNTPHTQLWPFSAGRDPDPKELDLLVTAVSDHYYWTPAEAEAAARAGSSAPLASPAPSRQARTAFTLSQLDLQRIQHLAQQMAWNVKPVQEAFEQRLLARKEPASSSSKSDPLRGSGSFSASNTPQSAAEAAAFLRRARKHSVTMDHDPQFNGSMDFSSPSSSASPPHSATAAASPTPISTSFSHMQLYSNSNTPSSAAAQAAAGKNGAGGAGVSVGAGSWAMGSTGRILHTSSRHRRPDDSDSSTSEMSDDQFSPPPPARHTHHTAAAATRARGASAPAASVSGFDANAPIRQIRRDSGASGNGVSGIGSGGAIPASSYTSPSKSSSSSSRSKGPNVALSLGKQLEELAEEDSD